MKKIKILIFIMLQIITISYVDAVNCNPSYNWNWTVTNNCDYPDWYKVNGNIYVWTYTITMWNNNDMWIDLSTKKITFTTWKINLSNTAKIANHVSSRYYISVSYNTNGSWTDCQINIAWNQCTHCPYWMHVFNRNSGSTPLLNWTSTYMWGTIKNMPSSGTFYCGTKWS